MLVKNKHRNIKVWERGGVLDHVLPVQNSASFSTHKFKIGKSMLKTSYQEENSMHL